MIYNYHMHRFRDRLPRPRGDENLVTLSPLQSALTNKHRVLPCFGRNYPSVSSLESALPQNPSASPLESALTKKGGGVLIDKDFVQIPDLLRQCKDMIFAAR